MQPYSHCSRTMSMSQVPCGRCSLCMLYVVIIMQSSLRNCVRNPISRLVLPLASITSYSPGGGDLYCAGSAVQLQTKVPEDYAKFYYHGHDQY